MSKENIITQLQEQGLEPSEKLGQHFLIDDGVISTLSQQVIEGSLVIEVGSGIGHVSEALAKRADKVIGVEIDPNFQPILEGLQMRNPKLNFIFGDVLQIHLDKLAAQAAEGQDVQIVSNPPYHITEPLMHRLIALPITNAILMLGDSAAYEMQQGPESPFFGRLSLLAQTFFNVRQVAAVPKTCFFPIPRTDSVIVDFELKDEREIKAEPVSFVIAALFRGEHKFGLVLNEMKQALVNFSLCGGKGTLSKRESHQRDRASVKRQMKDMVMSYNSTGLNTEDDYTRNDGRVLSQADAVRVIKEMGIPSGLLLKPFCRLDNHDMKALAAGLRNYYQG